MGRTKKKTNLLGDGDDVTGTPGGENRARVRRGVTPEREYPIFTPNSREPSFYVDNKDPSRRTSFQEPRQESIPLFQFHEPEGQGVWKEIHTDTQSLEDVDHMGSLYMPINPGHTYLTPSQKSLSPGQVFLKPGGSGQDSPGSNYPEPHSIDLSPHQATLLPPGVISMSTPRAKYFKPVLSPGRNNFIVTGRQASPTRAGISHSPQNVNILSPQLKPLGQSPKLTQLNISSPRLTDFGGLSPVVSHLASSPEFVKGLSDLSEPPLSSSMLPPAVNVRSPPQITFSSPVTSIKSTRSKKSSQGRHKESHVSPRPSVSKERSPGRSWKKSLRTTMSPGLASLKDEAQNAMRGIARDLGNSLGSKGRAAGSAAAALNSTPAPSWGRCGDGQAMVAPVALERDRSLSSSDEPELPPSRMNKKPPTVLKSGSHYNIFNFLNWGRKKNNTARLHESFQSDLGSVKVDSESIKVLDYTIKTLRYKLEQETKKRATAVNEVRALQAAMEVSEERCKQLQQRCQDLELQLAGRSSDFWDMESETENPTYIIGRRESNAGSGPHTGMHRFKSLEITPQLIAKMFEDSKACLRKLASAICHHIRDSGESATQVITSLLEQHKVGRMVNRMPRNVIILYFESFLNQVMFESFENVSFEPNGATSLFDPDAQRQASYQAYQDLRKQEWVNIEKSLGKAGSVVVNANFHRFFVVRMELVLSQLGNLAENDISLNLMASFFNAIKAVWLVHHLAFSFDSPVTLFRVAPGSDFDPRYMEQVTTFEEEPIRSKISIMVNPGFIVNRQTIKCQVFCSSKYQ